MPSSPALESTVPVGSGATGVPSLSALAAAELGVAAGAAGATGVPSLSASAAAELGFPRYLIRFISACELASMSAC